MGEYENKNKFMAKVNDLVQGIRCVSETLEEDEIVGKVLRSLSPTYKHKIAAIDEIWSVTTMIRDMLVGKIVAFEPSEFGESHGKSKTTFRASVSNKQKYEPKECRVSKYERERRDMKEQERELDKLEALISWRLPKGDGKYDGKLPLKCLCYNKVGHFSSRFLKRMAKYDRHDKFDKHDKNDRYEKKEKYDKTYKSNWKYRNQKNCYYSFDEGVIDDKS